MLTYLEGGIDRERFAIQLSMVADVKNAFQHSHIKSVTNVRTIAEGVKILRMLGEMHKILKIYFTLPVTTATAERSFSSLKRIKTFLQNSMTQSIFLCCVHPSRTDDLDLSYS